MLLAGELSDDYWTWSAATAAVPPDPLNLVQSLGGQVAFTISLPPADATNQIDVLKNQILAA